MEKPASRARLLTMVFIVTAAVIGIIVFSYVTRRPVQTVPYSTLLTRVEAGDISVVELGVQSLEATTKRGERLVALRVPEVDGQALVDRLTAAHVTVIGRPESEGCGSLLWSVLLIGALGLVLARIARARAAQAGAGPPLGVSTARTIDARKSDVRFSDVAGVDEAERELAEVVDFLRNPARYQALGAHIPKGVLLVGPPGTGKTLLAKALAGEGGVPFFSLVGSAFVELFVGVGAARMRSLFERAARSAPCIVFIDELDAVGKRRGSSLLAGNDEREQTLDQLLAEIDGFAPNAGVILLAATNRPDMLDPALVRPGRFDRQVLVDRPDQAGREAIVRVHARRLSLAPDVDLAAIARRVPGMVGADLANLVNEAALAAARRDAKAVAAADFDEALDRVLLGLARQSRVMSEPEKRRVATHEAGHALAATLVANADPIHRVSIIPRSQGALGSTVQLPTHDRHLVTEAELCDRLVVLVAGRAAEALVFADVSTGAEDDLARATELARLMTCRYGMSPTLGPVSLERRSAHGDDLVGAREVSEATARAIDGAVRERVDEALGRARALLAPRRGALEALACALIEHETLDRAAVDAIVGASEGAEQGPDGEGHAGREAA